MFFHIGTPEKITSLSLECPNMSILKKKLHVAIIDDEPFHRIDALRTHGFNLTELGGDIKSVEQVDAYPVVVCDIKGVGKAFGSKYEGAHVLSEIRKSYPDKYLISFSGATFDASFNSSFAIVDKSVRKDEGIEQWVTLLEDGLRNVGDPLQRWIRFRNSLLEKGVDIFEIFKLEQAFIKSIRSQNPLLMKSQVVPDEIKEVVLKFVSVALKQIIEEIVG